MEDWTDEEIADYEEWRRAFGQPSDDPLHDVWLEIAEAAFTCDREVPDC